MNLDRRSFLQVGALGVIAAVTTTVCTDKGDASLEQPFLLATLGPERVREIGAHYRAQTPSENTSEDLRAAIARSRGSRFFHRSIDHQVKDDFANGRTVLVDGWLLSVTEARQAALLSLHQG